MLLLATRTSIVPLPSASRAATVLVVPNGAGGRPSVIVSPKRPSPSPNCTCPVFVTRSGMPSPLKSPVAWLEKETPDEESSDGAGKVPVPLFSQALTVAFEAPPARSGWPSPLKSPTIGKLRPCTYVGPAACRVPPTWPLYTFWEVKPLMPLKVPAVKVRSVAPSPLQSPAARVLEGTVAMLRFAVVKLPTPVFVKMLRNVELLLLPAKSGWPSPLKSPTATELAPTPTAKFRGAWNVPSPLPSSTLTEPVAGKSVRTAPLPTRAQVSLLFTTTRSG